MRRLAMKMLTLALAVLLGGCATDTAALCWTGSASGDWIQFQVDKCMREAGWEQIPCKPDCSGWGPTAYWRPSAD